MIPDRMKPALQGVFPSHIVTASAAGIPNITSLSQVWYVDECHVALSHQYFRKTMQNIKENPYAFVKVLDPDSFMYWELSLKYVHSETEGSVFSLMRIKLDAIASLLDPSITFQLKGADIYKVLSCRECTEDWEAVLDLG